VHSSADRAHIWSFTEDVAGMPVGARDDPRAWGRALHLPSNEPRSQRPIIGDTRQAAGSGSVRVSAIPSVAIYGMGLVWPLMRELHETECEFRYDFIMDSSAARATFCLEPTPWDEIVAASLQEPDGHRPARASR